MLAATPAVLFALLSSSTLAVPAAAALNARSSAQPLATRSDFGDYNALNARSTQPFNPIEQRDASGLVGIFGDLLSLFLKRDEGSDASISKRDIVVLADIVARSSQSADPAEKRDASQIVGIIGDLLGFFLKRDEGSDASISKRDVSAIAKIVTQAQSLSTSDKAAVKTALMNKISTLHPTKRNDVESELDDRSLVGTAIDIGSGLLGDLLDAFLKRSDEFEINELD